MNTDQTFVSNTVLIFGDNLGDRRLIAQFQSLSSFTNFNFIYYNLRQRLQKGFALFDDRTYFLALDQRTGQDQIVRDRRAYRQTGPVGSALTEPKPAEDGWLLETRAISARLTMVTNRLPSR